MKKILLTSTGFDNKKFEELFVANVGKPINAVKALLVPTAAYDDESRSVIPFCRQDLTNAGVLDENVIDYDLDRPMGYEELIQYDAIYFCGGSEVVLMEAINRVGFASVLLQAVDKGLFYIGVSAGSMIASTSVENNLGIINNPLEPHCEENITPCGALPPAGEPVNISDNQAVWITDDKIEIIE